MEDDPLVQTPLSYLVKLILRGEEYVSIDPELAKTLLLLCQNKKFCYIQKPGDLNIVGEPLKGYLLWDFVRWQTSVDRSNSQRRWNDSLRVKADILRANIKILAESIAEMSGLSLEQATQTANVLLRRGKNPAPFLKPGIKLITTEEELKV